jgi:hypothetical protein
MSQASIGLNVQHDANHGAVSPNPFWNELLGFGADLIGGCKYLWLQQHWTHHAFTNDIERDPDASSTGVCPAPWFRVPDSGFAWLSATRIPRSCFYFFLFSHVRDIKPKLNIPNPQPSPLNPHYSCARTPAAPSPKPQPPSIRRRRSLFPVPRLRQGEPRPQGIPLHPAFLHASGSLLLLGVLHLQHKRRHTRPRRGQGCGHALWEQLQGAEQAR